jgi:hypothetical protein
MTSVRATEKFSVYWNYQVWSLAKGERVDGELADYLLATGSPVEQIDAEPASTPESGDGGGEDQVPDGTIGDVTRWVGDDAVRAARALEVELQRDPPRTTLVTALAKLTPTEPDPAPPAGS